MKKYRHKPETYVPINSRLRFIKRTLTVSGGSKALYECQCGTIVERLMNGVKRGCTKSCGCYSVDYPSRYVHGASNHPLYSVWDNMRRRCYDKKCESYSSYGGIGIYMCDDWLNDPNLFIDWALSNGWKRGLEVDKDIICNKLGLNPKFYSPDTCTIVTCKINSLHKTTSNYIIYNGVKKNITEWSRIYGVGVRTIRNRIKSDWAIENVFGIVPDRKHSGRRNIKRQKFKNENNSINTAF